MKGKWLKTSVKPSIGKLFSADYLKESVRDCKISIIIYVCLSIKGQLMIHQYLLASPHHLSFQNDIFFSLFLTKKNLAPKSLVLSSHPCPYLFLSPWKQIIDCSFPPQAKFLFLFRFVKEPKQNFCRDVPILKVKWTLKKKNNFKIMRKNIK